MATTTICRGKMISVLKIFFPHIDKLSKHCKNICMAAIITTYFRCSFSEKRTSNRMLEENQDIYTNIFFYFTSFFENRHFRIVAGLSPINSQQETKCSERVDLFTLSKLFSGFSWLIFYKATYSKRWSNIILGTITEIWTWMKRVSLKQLS